MAAQAIVRSHQWAKYSRTGSLHEQPLALSNDIGSALRRYDPQVPYYDLIVREETAQGTTIARLHEATIK